MDGVITIQIQVRTLLLATMVVLGLLGLRRGAARELLAMGGIGLGLLVTLPLARVLAPRLEIVVRLVRLLFGGLRSEPGALAVAAAPVAASEQPEHLALVLFVGLVAAAYLMGQLRLSSPSALMPRLLGLAVGAGNGFLLANHLLPRAVGGSGDEVGALAAAPTAGLLADPRAVGMAVVFVVAVLIAFGLYSASGRQRQS